MRYNRIRTLLAALLIGACLSATAYADTAIVTGSEVNVRSGPGKDYAVLGSYSRGSSVEVIDRSNSAWYAVRYGNQTGYMSSDYLSIQEDSQPAQITTVQPTEQPVGQATVLVPGQASIVLPGQDGIVITGPAATPTPAPTLTAPVATPAPTREPTLAAPSNVPTVSQTPTLAVPTPVPTAAPTPVPTPAPTPAPTVTPGSAGQIDGMYVRFRSGPSSSSAILGEYNRGKALTVLGVDGDWTMCQIDGETGYVFSQYVSVSAPAATPAPTNAPTLASAPAPTGILIESTPVPAATPAPTAVPAPAQTTAQTSASIAGDHVRFRSGPSTGYSILGTYDRGKALTVLGTDGDWTYCSIDGQTGYVFTQYVQTASAAQTTLPAPTLATGTLPAGFTAQPTAGMTVSSGTGSTSTTALTGYIKGNNVRFRAGPDLSSEILRELFYGNAVTITGTDGTWTAISYEGESGYVFSQYVATGTYQPVSSGGTASGREIADFALQYVGTPYCWGGKDPSTGFDCSGFMYFVFQHFGYTLNRVASEQALNGRHIEASELQPGDLLCFYSGGSYIGHVGLYIGNNTFVHAATSTTGVITSELTGYYAKRGFEARRIAG